MKHLYLTLAVCVYAITSLAQNQADIYTRIDSAKTVDNIPPITVTVSRDGTHMDGTEKKFNYIKNVSIGDKYTLYFPIYVINDTSYARVSELFNAYATEREFTKKTPIISNLLINHISYYDRKLLVTWAYKFTTLSNKKMKEEAEKPKELTPEESQSELQARMRAMSRMNHNWHDLLTIFTGELEFNFCHGQLLEFLERKMRMGEVSNEMKNGYVTSKIKDKVSSGTAKQLTIKYEVHSKGNYYFIDKATITGTRRSVIDLFLLYWPTRLQEGNIKKGEWAYCYMLPDKIGLLLDTQGNARIEITNTNKKALN